jgi:type II secretory pathway pseudopilin PulG
MRAMTLVEMAIVGMVVGAGLFLLTGWMSTFRQSSKRDLAIRLLRDLDIALARYHRATGAYPPSYGPHSAISATLILRDHERTAPLLDALPPSLWRDARIIVDPWGTPLRYHATPEDSPLVKANNNRPLFVSAGPDRDFGDASPARLGDNLRSDDPDPVKGFRVHDIMRDTLSGKEHESGEKDDRPDGGG